MDGFRFITKVGVYVDIRLTSQLKAEDMLSLNRNKAQTNRYSKIQQWDIV
jgi:hypothetical protein